MKNRILMVTKGGDTIETTINGTEASIVDYYRQNPNALYIHFLDTDRVVNL
jgi:hypothetical protein